jgi:hypothetical protein
VALTSGTESDYQIYRSQNNRAPEYPRLGWGGPGAEPLGFRDGSVGCGSPELLPSTRINFGGHTGVSNPDRKRRKETLVDSEQQYVGIDLHCRRSVIVRMDDAAMELMERIAVDRHADSG